MPWLRNCARHAADLPYGFCALRRKLMGKGWIFPECLQWLIEEGEEGEKVREVYSSGNISRLLLS